jgi:mannitol-1-phosphate 5-dehydrogenase
MTTASGDLILVIGAGAIGRGFLPWVFPENRYRFGFIDTNDTLIESLRCRGRYTSYMADPVRGLRPRVIPVAAAWHPADFTLSATDRPVICYVAVGPRRVCEAVAKLKGYDGPIVLLENDDKSVEVAKAALNQDNVYFAIPDVIASNTASPEHLADDPLALHTEDGTLHVDARAHTVEGAIDYCTPDELRKQWLAKLYLHNTPHCVAAYLGAFLRLTYVHEVMAHPGAAKIVRGSVKEMLKALKLGWDISHDFLDWYAEKELRRFSNVALHDPITRVAREPFRKLQLDGRLIGAALMCMKVGFVPINVLMGIVAAVLFDDGCDPDRHIIFAKDFLPPSIVFSYLLQLRPGEPLHAILSDHFVDIVHRLESLRGVPLP